MTKAKGELPSTKKKWRLKKGVKVSLIILSVIVVGVIVYFTFPNKIVNAEKPTAIVTEVVEIPGVPNIIEEVDNEKEVLDNDSKTSEKNTTKQKTKATEQKSNPVKEEVQVSAEQSNDVVYGSMTGYGANCQGCSGITASGYDVRNTIWYNDATYGKVRIVAAPKNIPFYTVMKVSGVKGQEPFLAIVLDRGGAIKGTLFDLLCESEAYANKYIGRQKNVTYEILRRGK